jgi:hypothetical protein
MASVITKFMGDYSDTVCISQVTPKNDKTSTRRLRRKEMQSAIVSVTAILNAEAGSLGRIPENFQDSDTYAESERIVEALEVAIESLEEVYS